MRMKQSRLTKVRLCHKTVEKDGEGVPIITYGAPVEVTAEVWPASDRLQAETYGDRIRNIQNIRIRGDYTIECEEDHIVFVYPDFTVCPGDGVCIYTDTAPDYRIIGAIPYKPLRLEVERI